MRKILDRIDQEMITIAVTLLLLAAALKALKLLCLIAEAHV
jgi:hypothetical protein